MTIRTRYKVDVSISSNYAEHRDLGNACLEVVSDKLNIGGGWKTVVPMGSSNIQLQLDNQTNVQFLVLRTNTSDPTLSLGPITVAFNSPTGSTMVIQPLPGCQEGHMLVSTTGITALYASNSGADDVEVTIWVAGS